MHLLPKFSSFIYNRSIPQELYAG